MQLYHAVVGNDYYWSVVRVWANDKKAARGKIECALESREWLAQAQEEYAMGQMIDGNTSTIENYLYNFHDFDDDYQYVEVEDTRTPFDGVRLVESGGNG